MNRPQTSAEAMMETLRDHEVKVAFGYVGGAMLPVADALQTAGEGIEFVHTRHEQGATHMAHGYAEASGKPGVAIVTSGPGFTNAITGLMTAQMDSAPIIVYSGQVPTFAPRDAFQSADSIALARSVTKYRHKVTSGSELPYYSDHAFRAATSGRPGAVFIDIPKNVAAAPYVESDAPWEPHRPDAYDVDMADIRAIADVWERADRPVILAGHGVIISGGHDELRQLAELTDTPVTTTLLGKGAFPETHALSLGMLGMHGTAYANRAVDAADLVVNIGSRFDDRIVGDSDHFAAGAYKVHVDIDKDEIGKIINPNIGIVADGRQFLRHILGEMALRGGAVLRHDAWNARIDADKREFPLTYEKGNGLTMQQVIDETYRLTGGNAIVTTDVGQHQMWAAQYWKTGRPRDWITSGGAGTMGFGLPAAIGAQLARPGEQVISFVGDGGFQMTMNELVTAARYKLPIKVFILDNQYLGMVRQWQDTFYDGRKSGVDMSDNPDFVKIAEACGAAGVYIGGEEDLQAGLERVFSIKDRPVVVHVQVRQEDDVYPFIPAGGKYSEMQTGPSNAVLAQPRGST